MSVPLSLKDGHKRREKTPKGDGVIAKIYITVTAWRPRASGESEVSTSNVSSHSPRCIVLLCEPWKCEHEGGMRWGCANIKIIKKIKNKKIPRDVATSVAGNMILRPGQVELPKSHEILCVVWEGAHLTLGDSRSGGDFYHFNTPGNGIRLSDCALDVSSLEPKRKKIDVE